LLVGVLIGLVLGLSIALGVAWIMNKGRVRFFRGPSRGGAGDAGKADT